MRTKKSSMWILCVFLLVLWGGVACQPAHPVATQAVGSNPEPSAPSVKASPPKITQSWFTVDPNASQSLIYVLFLESTETGKIVEHIQYDVIAYDEKGAVLGSESDSFSMLYPGQPQPSLGSIQLTTPGAPARIEAKFTDPGQAVAFKDGPGGSQANPIVVEGAYSITKEDSTFVLAGLTNTLDLTVRDVGAVAIGYDESGKLIDAGSAFVYFIHPGKQVGVQARMVTGQAPARVEVFARAPGRSYWSAASQDELIITNVGARRSDPTTVKVIFIVENRAKRAFTQPRYTITVYAQDGSIAGVEMQGGMGPILPGGQGAEAAYINILEGADVVRADVQMQPELRKPKEDLSAFQAFPLRSDQLVLAGEKRNWNLTATIANSLDRNLGKVSATAVLFDEEGQILDGASDFIDFVPAQGQAQVDFNFSTPATPAEAAVFPGISNAKALLEPAEKPAASAPPDSEPPAPTEPLPAQPASAPTIASAPVKFLAQWVGAIASNGVVPFAILAENPNPSLEMRSVELKIDFLDAAGTSVGAQNVFFHRILPGQQSAICAYGTIKDGAQIANMQVALANPGQAAASEFSQPPIQVEQVQYKKYEEVEQVTGVYKNRLNQDVLDIELNALAFDGDGKIVGCGSVFSGAFVAGQGQTAVRVPLATTAQAASAVIYPALDSSSISSEPFGGPLSVSASGFAQAYGSSIYYAFTIANAGADIMDVIAYQVTAYDDAGTVLGIAQEDDFHTILRVPAAGNAGLAGHFNVPKETVPTRLEVQLVQKKVEKAWQSPVQIEQPVYQENPFPAVTAVVMNTTGGEVKLPGLAAVVYDAQGNIIGGGVGSPMNIVANGKQAVQIMVNIHANTVADRVEVFAMMYPVIEN